MEVIIEDAQAKDFSNIGGSFDCDEVQCNIKMGSQQVAEKFQVTLGALIIQPTFANEEREIKFVVGNATGNIPFFNITISEINENQIFFEMIPVGIAESVEIEIEGAKLFEIHVNGINHTFTFTTQGAGNNKIVIDDIETTPNNVTAFFVQSPDIEFATHGRSLEGDFINNFTKLQREHVLGWVENFNVPFAVQDQLFTSTVIDGQKTYEIAGKMKLGFFGNDPLTISAGTAYVKAVNGSTTFLEIFDKLEEEVSLATGRNDTGNVPNAGKEPEDD